MMNLKTGEGASRPVLLIIDDSAINRAVLAEIFRPLYQIEEAENGRDGLARLLARQEEICAVLLDVVMPVMDGIQLLRLLQEQGIPEKIPVFLVTADPSDEVTREAYSLGVMDVIGKPVVPHIVSRRVCSVIELFQARRKLARAVEEQQAEIERQTREIVELNKGMIEALATSIEFRSSESGEHVQRIHDITKILLEETSFGASVPRENAELIAMASIMHDVGKIAIPDAILNKPGRLTPEEFEIMKTHTVQGARLLEKIPQLQQNEIYAYARDIARHHHERWDGRGYPDGLRGDEITPWAQIVSIADVYDALVSKRVYKDSYQVEEALEMIRTGKCGVFNPSLLESFFAVEGRIRRLYRRG